MNLFTSFPLASTFVDELRTSSTNLPSFDYLPEQIALDLPKERLFESWNEMTSMFFPEMSVAEEEALSVLPQLPKIGTAVQPDLPANSLEYQLDWCLRNGKMKGQQYWVYCEESQDNFAKFSLLSSEINITEASRIMKDCNGKFYIVEDYTTPFISAVPLSTANTNRRLLFPNSQLNYVDPSTIHASIKLVKDCIQPVHPGQGEAEVVKIESSLAKGKFPWSVHYPFEFMFRIKCRGRSEGWFRLELSLSYEQEIIFVSKSKTFMLNNPRLKKMKEHKLYTPEELKFMQIYAIANTPSPELLQAEKWKEIGSKACLANIDLLLHKASHLFPQKKTNLKKRKRKVQQAEEKSLKRVKLEREVEWLSEQSQKQSEA